MCNSCAGCVLSLPTWSAGLAEEHACDVDVDVATGVNYGVASIWSKSTCNPATGISRIRVPPRPLPPFKFEHLDLARTGWPAPHLPRKESLGSQGSLMGG